METKEIEAHMDQILGIFIKSKCIPPINKGLVENEVKVGQGRHKPLKTDNRRQFSQRSKAEPLVIKCTVSQLLRSGRKKWTALSLTWEDTPNDKQVNTTIQLIFMFTAMI